MGESLILIYLIRKVGSLIPGCSSLHAKLSFRTSWTPASPGAFIGVWMLAAFSQRDMLSKALYKNHLIYHIVFGHAWMIIFSIYVSQNTPLGCHNAFITHKIPDYHSCVKHTQLYKKAPQVRRKWHECSNLTRSCHRNAGGRVDHHTELFGWLSATSSTNSATGVGSTDWTVTD